MAQNPQQYSEGTTNGQQGHERVLADLESIFRYLAKFHEDPGTLNAILKSLEVGDLEINGEISGASWATTIADPGSDTKGASEQAIRELHESNTIAAGKSSWAEFFVLAGLP